MSEYDLQKLINKKVNEHEMRVAQLEDKEIMSSVVPSSTYLERIRHDLHNRIAK